MITTGSTQDLFEVSPRFRQSIETRILRLQQDADRDESQIVNLADIDHIRRHMRLVSAQRAEAERMRSFLDRTVLRAGRPMIAL